MNTRWRTAAGRAMLLAAVWATGALLAQSKGLLDPADKRGAWERSLAAASRGDDQAALRLLERLLFEDPDNPVYLEQAADAYHALGNFREAAAAAERYLKVALRPTETCPFLGDQYSLLGDRERALDAHRRCLELEPGNPYFAFNYAQALESLGRFSQAEQAYRQVIEASPYFVGASLAIARMRLKEGRPQEADAVVLAVLRRSPRNAAALMLAAQAAAAMGRNRAAMERVRAAIGIDPRHPELYRMLGRLCLQTGDPCAAAAWAGLLRIQPDDPEARLWLDAAGKGKSR